jgi:calcineurin-like phosphoesterase family protein
VVKQSDEVIVIGDAVYTFASHWAGVINSFNGRKTLIRGNHDRNVTNAIYSNYFDRIIDEGDGLEMEFGGIPCWLTHYPSCGKIDKFNLVGHIHGAWKYQLNMFNVGVDVNHFYPVSGDKIAFHYEAIMKYYDDDVWIAYSDLNCSYRGNRGKQGSYFKN